MANFVQSLHALRNSELPLEELLLKIDRMILSDPTSAQELLQTLLDENTQAPLPQQIFETIKQNIQKRAKEVYATHNTQAPTSFISGMSDHNDLDEERTRIAPAFSQDPAKPTDTSQAQQQLDAKHHHSSTQAANDPAKDNESPLLPITDVTHAIGRIDDDLTKIDSALMPDSDDPKEDTSTVEETLLAELIGVSQPIRDKRIKGTGDVLNGRFELKECLGSGGMSTVYKALDRRKQEANDRHPYVAVKVLNQDFRDHPDSLIALQREAKKSQSLAHPNIVRVYDFDRDGETIYMTMEYLSGESLGVKINTPGFKGLPADEAFPIIQSMGKALSFAHENGIVHADFKPANVYITDRGAIKVIDFGIARAFSRAEDPSSLELTRFDPGSLGALTPSYASPEMLELQEPDPRDDIYALACTTYELLTGQHPFKRMQANVARDSGIKIEGLETLNRKQRKALQEALEFKREKRTPTVDQFLDQFLPPKSNSKRFPVVSSILGLLLLGGLSLGYFLFVTDMQFFDFASETQPADLLIPQTTDTLPGVDQSQDLHAKDKASTTSPLPSSDTSRETFNADSEKPESTTSKPATLASISPLLKRLPCAALQTSVEDGRVTLNGYAKQVDVTRLKQELLTLNGVTHVNNQIKGFENAIHCQVIELLAPFWTANKQQQMGTSIQTNKPGARFSAGEYLVLNIKSPYYKAYMAIDYYSLDGGVVHMLPSPRSPNNLAPARYSATLGDLGEWRVGEPFGTEMIVILATSEPLFDTPRKEFETQAEYLPELRKKLLQMQGRIGSDRISADFQLISTSP